MSAPKGIFTSWKDFLHHLSDTRASSATIRNYKSDIAQFIKFARVNTLEELFVPEQLTAFSNFQREKGLKESSILRKEASITQFGLWANINPQKDETNTNQAEYFLAKFLHHLQEQQSSEATIRNYKSDIKQFIDFSGAKDIKELLKKDQLTAFSNFQREKGLKESSILRKEASISQFFLWAKQSQNTKELTRAEKIQAESLRLKLHNFILPYLNLGLIILFFLGLGVFGFWQLKKDTPELLAYPITPTTADRILSFQGRLTNAALTPITTATNVEFKVWDQLSAGTEGSCDGANDCWYKTNTCSVTPDQDGIFNVSIGAGAGAGADGSDCGAEIGADVFSENAALWLEVKVGTETLAPRQPVRSVPFAINAENVQGFPINATESATTNTLLVMDESGQVILGEVGPTVKSVSGTFTIEGMALTLQSSSGSNGDINLSPDGTGAVFVNSNLTSTGYLYAPGATISATYAGGIPLTVKAGPSATANITEWQNSTGTPLVTISNVGGLSLTDDLTITGDDLFMSTNTANYFLMADGTNYNPTSPADARTGIGLVAGGTGDIWVEKAGDIMTGDLILNTQSDLRLADSDSSNYVALQAPATVGTNVTWTLPDADATSANQVLASNAAGGLSWIDSTSISGGLWTNTLNVLHPTNPAGNVVDLTIGGTSTASADIQLFSNGAAVFNEQSNDADFRVESNGNANMLFVDAGNNAVGIGIAPGETLDVAGFIRSQSLAPKIWLYETDGSADANFGFYVNSGAMGVGTYDDSGALQSTAMTFLQSGSIGVGDTSPAALFTVGNTDLFQIDTTGSIINIDGVAHSISDTTGELVINSAGTKVTVSDDLEIVGDDLFMSTNTANYFLMADGTNYNPTSPADARTGIGLVAGGTGDIWVEKAGDTMVGNLILNDNVSLLLGTGSDLELYHDGTNSYIQSNTGDIIVENDVSNEDLVFKVNVGGTDTTVMTAQGLTGNLGIGIAAPTSTLHIYAAYSNAAGLVVDQRYSGDIIAASASGTPVFRVDNSGYTYSQRFLDLANTAYFLDPAATDISLTTVGKVGHGIDDPEELLEVEGYVTGKALVSFNQLDPETTQDIFTASASSITKLRLTFAGNLLPGVTEDQDIGSDALRWDNLFLGGETIHIGTNTTDEAIIGYTTGANAFTFTNNYGDTNFTTSSDGYNFTLGGGAGDDFIVDSTTLVVESDNDRVGIGTAAPAKTLDVNGDIQGQDIYVTGGEIILTGLASPSVTTEGTIYYDTDNDHLFVRAGDSAWHRLAQDMTKYSASRDATAHGGYLEVAHNQATNDLLATGWEYATPSAKYEQILENYGANHNTGDSTLDGFWETGDASASLADTMGNANLTDKGSATYQQAGQIDAGYSVYLDGASDYFCYAPGGGPGFTCADGGIFDITGSLTFGGWVKPVNDNNALLGGKWDATEGQQSYVFFYDANGNVEFYATSDGTTDAVSIVDAFTIPRGQWSFVTAVIDTSTSQAFLYVNGRRVGVDDSGISSVFNSTIPFELASYDGGTNKFSGNIDDVFLYSRALTAEDVREIYEYGVKRYKVEQTDTNNVRLYNYTGETQKLRLDVTVFGADLAEWYSTDDASIQAGDVVAFTGEKDAYSVPKIRKAQANDTGQLAGIVSTKAGQELGIPMDNRRLVGLSGRVPVKVDPNSPPIKTGDFVTSSSLGYARKASGAGYSVARALEDWSPEAGQDKILVFIDSSYYDSQLELDSLGDLIIQTNIATSEATASNSAGLASSSATLVAVPSKTNITYILSNKLGEVINKIAAFAQLASGEIKTNLISPLASEDFILNLAENKKLTIRDHEQNTIASIDDQGNASFSGQLQAQSARMTQLESKLAEFEEIKAQAAELVNATISGTLYAENIADFNQKISSALEEPSLLEKLMAPVSTASANLDFVKLDRDEKLISLDISSDEVVLESAAMFIDKYFEVNGDAYINNIITSSISSQTDTLLIQPSGLGSISFLKDLLVLDESGLATINGNLKVTGNLTVENTLLTNLLAPTDFGNPLQVQLASKSGDVLGESRFEIINELGTPVATISAQGKAEFSAGIGIGSEDLTSQATESGEVNSNKTSGTAKISSQQNQVLIKTESVKANSLIYVTALGSTGNQVLYVKNQSDGNFTVGFDNPINFDVKFNYWIIN